MTDELRRLAEAANDGLPWAFQPRGYGSSLDVLDEDTDAYIRSANPQRILALLDVVEAGQPVADAWDAAVDHADDDGFIDAEYWEPLVRAHDALREALDRLEALA